MHKKYPGLILLKNVTIVFIFILLFAGRCNRGLRAIQAENAIEAAKIEKTKNLISSVKGIKYTEVRRQFDNGLSFSPEGYQLIPEWKISFPSRDSVTIFSPKKNKFLNAPVVFDHDSIFNVAWAWLKLKYIKKDSMQFMVLHVDGRVIINEKVHVYMTFYSNDYIKNVLHTDTTKLWRPSKRDTGYIKKKSQQANINLDSAFSGTTPPILTAINPRITVKKEIVQDGDVNGGQLYDNYLSPTFDIVIHHAYEDFSYQYTAFVDENGKITFRKSLVYQSHEFEASYNTAMKGITDGYLKLYLDTKPAKTLGIPHSSIIFLNVEGFKN